MRFATFMVFAAAIGCSSLAPPNEQIANAEMAIRKVDDSQGSRYAALDLLKAREKLDKAKLAMQEKEYTDARRLAEQAMVDALLAEEKARTAQSKETAREMARTVESLRREAERFEGQQGLPAR